MYATPNLFDKLELTKDNGLFIFSENEWRGLFPQKIEYALQQIKPYAFFTFNEEPLILFFDFLIEKRDEKIIHKQCWNFNKAPIIFINKDSEVSIFNGFSFNHTTEKLAQLADYKEIDKFNYWKIVTGKLWEEYQKDFKKENRVDFKLLKNIEKTRDILINVQKLDKTITNRLIGRLIFTRYLIDRRVNLGYTNQFGQKINKKNLSELIANKSELYTFFGKLRKDFNGDLFPLKEEKGDRVIIEEEIVHENHLLVIKNLFSGHDIDGQLSLFNIYDFGIIPVEFVSNVYEYFMGKDRQEKDKAFYTPPFLVDYILSQTIVPHFKQTKSTNCRTLDPACGSGIFLVETLRLIVAKYQKENPKINQSSDIYKNAIKNLLVNNIFGIDKNKEAIEIAVFSLYITLLDFFEAPKDIKEFKFPPLFKTNFFVGDFFNERHEFNEVLTKEKPQFILGNPPWGKVSDSPYMDYIAARSKRECEKINVSNKQIAQAFLLRVSDFCNVTTKCTLIVSSKILYNLRADKFRAYFLNKFKIKEVLEISPVRKLIFAKAVGPAAILTYEFANGKNTDDNFVEHISLKPNPFFALFKSILIEKYDYKEIKQSYFKKFDWIWKVLVYGSILDFYFIKKLKNRDKYPKTVISVLKEYELLFSTGVNKGTVDKNDASHLIGLPYLDNNKKDVQRYSINYRKDSLWSLPVVHRPRNPDLYKAPILLFKNGLQNNFSLVGTVAYNDVVFTTNMFGIKNYKNNNILENLLAVLLSELSTYHLFLTGSSTGIEREQLMFEEIYSFPVMISDRIVEKVKNILNLHVEKHASIDDNHYNNLIKRAEENLNQLINSLYALSKKDKHLLNYAFNISIPSFQMGTSTSKSYKNFPPYKTLKIKSKELALYANILTNHYNKIAISLEKKIHTTIYCTENIIAINFEFVNELSTENLVWKTEGEGYLDFLATTAFQKVSSHLFIQKDIKGVRKNSFYILKPNQFKLWHPAIAHLDILELDNKMINLELNQTENVSL